MPQYPDCMVHKGLVPCTGIVVSFSGAWQSFIVEEVEETQQVGIQARNPFISSEPVL
jgi:hypothetical protein